MVIVEGRRDVKIGVLALQGAFIEHIAILERLGARTARVRLPEHLADLDGLIIPGGESTTICKLAISSGLAAPLREFALEKPVWGVCAGLIYMAADIGSDQPTLGLLDIVVKRNAFGRQSDSFVEYIAPPPRVDNPDKPFKAVFIRAPKIIEAKGKANIIAVLRDGTAAAVLEGHWLGTAFHPELTDDDRFHRFFVKMAENGRASGNRFRG